MKRVSIGLLVLLVAISGLVAALPLLVSSENVRNRVLTRLQDMTGRQVSFRGNPSVSFSPFLGIEVSDLVIADPLAGPGDPPLLNVEKIQAELDILPALFGQVKITKYRLIRPSLSLKVGSNGKSNWHFEKGTLKEALQTGNTSTGARSVDIGEFTIVDAAIEYEDRISGLMVTVTSLGGELDWRNTSGSLSFTGNGIWRGENISLESSIENPAILISGGESEITTSLVSQPMNFEFSGMANMLSDLFVKGSLKADSPSLARLSDFLELEIGQFGILGNLEASGELHATPGDIRLAEARVSVEGHEANGAIRLNKNEAGVSKLDGTLAFGNIDVTSFFPASSENAAASRKAAKDFKVDLRISANSINLGKVDLQEVAAAITVDEGNWTFDIGDSHVFDGNLIAKISERSEDDKRLMFVEFSGKNLAAENLVSIFSDKRLGLSGRVSVNSSLRSDNVSGTSFIRRLNGAVDILISNGSLNGIDLPRLLDSGNPDGETESVVLGEGNTPFQKMSVNFFLNGGIASLSKAVIEREGPDIQLLGNADFESGNIALRAQKLAEDGPQPERLFIGGNFSNPLVTLQHGPQTTPPKVPQEEKPEGISN